MVCSAELRILLLMSGYSRSVECSKKQQTDKTQQKEEQKPVQRFFLLHHFFKIKIIRYATLKVKGNGSSYE
ncbi:MAG: hypothetical protein D3910_14670 [Candidatus Electrothrix sp. ATG2]|nr:hypothetical protein [Candidatus Electrothrix sp. ATG2]